MEKGDPARQGKMAVTEAQGQLGGLPLWGRHQRTKVALRRKESKTKPGERRTTARWGVP